MVHGMWAVFKKDMSNKKQILIIDDKAEVRLSARFFLNKHGFDVLEADGPTQGLALIKSTAIDLVLLDMNFSLDTTSGEEGLYCLRKIRQWDEFLPVVAITAWSSTHLVVKALQEGAQDFVEKPWDNHRLLQVIKQSLRLGNLEKEQLKLVQQAHSHCFQVDLIAHSASMQALVSQLNEVASTNATILLTGENGTGKSTLARYIHQLHQQCPQQSPQRTIVNSNKLTASLTEQSSELISVNMGAIPENLFESEMFGHIKGAFTGAHQTRIGRFELAEHGTLFLDEIADIPLASQAKLLRILESGEYERVGSSITQTATFRLISATNASFNELLNNGSFRQDLYFRLNTIELRVPALRERKEDIAELADILLNKLCLRYHKAQKILLPCAYQALSNYHFPGNLRELSHILERAVLLNKNSEIGAEHLNISDELSIQHSKPQQAKDGAAGHLSLMTIEQAERQLLALALRQTNGQVLEAAQLLGLSKSAIYRRLEKYQIIAKDYLTEENTH